MTLAGMDDNVPPPEGEPRPASAADFGPEDSARMEAARIARNQRAQASEPLTVDFVQEMRDAGVIDDDGISQLDSEGGLQVADELAEEFSSRLRVDQRAANERAAEMQRSGINELPEPEPPWMFGVGSKIETAQATEPVPFPAGKDGKPSSALRQRLRKLKASSTFVGHYFNVDEVPGGHVIRVEKPFDETPVYDTVTGEYMTPADLTRRMILRSDQAVSKQEASDKKSGRVSTDYNNQIVTLYHKTRKPKRFHIGALARSAVGLLPAGRSESKNRLKARSDALGAAMSALYEQGWSLAPDIRNQRTTSLAKTKAAILENLDGQLSDILYDPEPSEARQREAQRLEERIAAVRKGDRDAIQRELSRVGQNRFDRLYIDLTEPGAGMVRTTVREARQSDQKQTVIAGQGGFIDQLVQKWGFFNAPNMYGIANVQKFVKSLTKLTSNGNAGAVSGMVRRAFRGGKWDEKWINQQAGVTLAQADLDKHLGTEPKTWKRVEDMLEFKTIRGRLERHLADAEARAKWMRKILPRLKNDPALFEEHLVALADDLLGTYEDNLRDLQDQYIRGEMGGAEMRSDELTDPRTDDEDVVPSEALGIRRQAESRDASGSDPDPYNDEAGAVRNRAAVDSTNRRLAAKDRLWRALGMEPPIPASVGATRFGRLAVSLGNAAMDKEVATLVEGIRRTLGLRDNFVIFNADSLDLMPHEGKRRELAERNPRGNITQLTGDDGMVTNYIYLRGEELPVLMHELGHAVKAAFWHKLSKPVQDRIMADFHENGTQDQDFEEWMANQFMVWSFKPDTKANNAVEAFFKRVAAALRTIWDLFKGYYGVRLTTTYEEFIDAVVANQKNGVWEDTDHYYDMNRRAVLASLRNSYAYGYSRPNTNSFDMKDVKATGKKVEQETAQETGLSGQEIRDQLVTMSRRYEAPMPESNSWWLRAPGVVFAQNVSRIKRIEALPEAEQPAAIAEAFKGRGGQKAFAKLSAWLKMAEEEGRPPGVAPEDFARTQRINPLAVERIVAVTEPMPTGLDETGANSVSEGEPWRYTVVFEDSSGRRSEEVHENELTAAERAMVDFDAVQRAKAKWIAHTKAHAVGKITAGPPSERSERIGALEQSAEDADFTPPGTTSLSESVVAWLTANGVRIERGDEALADLPRKVATIPENATPDEAIAHVGAQFAAILSQHHPAVRRFSSSIMRMAQFKEMRDGYVSRGYKRAGAGSTHAVRNIVQDAIELALLERADPKSGAARALRAKYNSDGTLLGRIAAAVREFFAGFLPELRREPAVLKLGRILADSIMSGQEMVPGAAKPGTVRVQFGDALARNPNGAAIVTELAGSGDERFALVGSLANAAQGAVFRDPNVMLHDIDFVFSGDPDDAAAALKKAFPGAEEVYQFSGSETDELTTTYIVPPKGHSLSNITRRKGGVLVISYDVLDSAGNVVGSYRADESGKNEVYKGERAYPVDIFTNGTTPDQTANAYVHEYNGKQYRLGRAEAAFAKKIFYGRFKDTRDYAAYRTEDDSSADFTPPSLRIEQAVRATLRKIPSGHGRGKLSGVFQALANFALGAQHAYYMLIATADGNMRHIARRHVREGKVDTVEQSAYWQIANMFRTPPGHKAQDADVDTFYRDRHDARLRFTGRFRKELKGLSEAELKELHEAMRAGTQARSEKVRAAQVKVRETLDEVLAWMQNRGLPIGKKQNYWPVMFSDAKLAEPGAKEEFIAGLEQNEGYTYEGALDLWNKLNDGLSETYLQDNMPVEAGLGSQSMIKHRKFFDSLNDKEWAEQFLDTNPLTILESYITKAANAGAWNIRFGQKARIDEKTGEWAKWDPNFKWKTMRDMARKQGATTPDMAKLERMKDAYIGRVGLDMPYAMRKFLGAIMVYQNLRLLAFATIASFQDVVGPSIRAGNVRYLWKTLAESMKGEYLRDEPYRIGRAIGIINDTFNDHILSEGLDNHYTSQRLRNVNEKFFTLIGLKSWTNFTRAAAVRTGVEALHDYAQVAQGTGEKAAHAKEWLAELGLTADEVMQWAASRERGGDGRLIYGESDMTREAMQLGRGREGVNTDQLDRAEKVARALRRFADESILRPDAAMRPAWASNPMMMLFWHLKSFMYAFSMTTLARISYNLNGTNVTSAQVSGLVAAMMLFPIAAMGLELRELIQYGTRESPYDRMDTMEYLFTIMSRAGFLGLTQLAWDTAEAEERGKIGILSTFGGPVADQIQSALQMPPEKSFTKAFPGLAQLPGLRKAVENAITD